MKDTKSLKLKLFWGSKPRHSMVDIDELLENGEGDST